MPIGERERHISEIQYCSKIQNNDKQLVENYGPVLAFRFLEKFWKGWTTFAFNLCKWFIHWISSNPMLSADNTSIFSVVQDVHTSANNLNNDLSKNLSKLQIFTKKITRHYLKIFHQTLFWLWCCYLWPSIPQIIPRKIKNHSILIITEGKRGSFKEMLCPWVSLSQMLFCKLYLFQKIYKNVHIIYINYYRAGQSSNILLFHFKHNFF